MVAISRQGFGTAEPDVTSATTAALISAVPEGRSLAMASTKTLNAANLERLGAARLAALLIEVSAGSAVAKRRLRLELAGAAGGDDAARAIHKRITSLAKAGTFIDWRRTAVLVKDLEVQHRAIVDHVAPTDPAEALALLWRFLRLADPIFARCDDGSGRVLAVFRNAVPDLAPLVAAAKVTPGVLSASVFDAVQDANHGQWDALVETLAPQLGETGLDDLKGRVRAWLAEAGVAGDATSLQPGSIEPPRTRDDRVEARRREVAGRFALERIADARRDVDGFVAQQTAGARAAPAVATAIARRLLDAGRAGEALAALDAADVGRQSLATDGWEDARLDALETLGRHDEAQAFRWELFTRTLGARHLRTWLRRLPFEDFDGEQRAFAHAMAFPDVHRAAAFLVAWPAMERASTLLLTRAGELDGDLYETLAPLADTLESTHPLAATLALRAMIDFTLRRSRSSRYEYARQHLATCAALAERIDDFGDHPDHATYEERLRGAHGRRAAFW